MCSLVGSRQQSRDSVNPAPLPLQVTSQGYLHPILARLAIDASGVSREKTEFCTLLLDTTFEGIQGISRTTSSKMLTESVRTLCSYTLITSTETYRLS